MTFKSQLKEDAFNCFLNSNEFAEEITYTPKAGMAKNIKAVVERKRLSPAGEDTGRTLIDAVEIFIANDPVYGVTSINKGGDTVALPERISGVNITWSVVEILAQDPGVWHLLLAK